MSFRDPRTVHITIIVLCAVLILSGGIFYYVSDMDPAFIREDALPRGWYQDVDSTDYQSARFGLAQQNRYVYVRETAPPAVLSVLTFHNVLPQSSEDNVINTMSAFMKNLAKEQGINITDKRGGTIGKSSYLEFNGNRSLDRFRSEQINLYGECWKEGYGTYVMCIGMAKVGESSFLTQDRDTTSYDEMREILIPSIRQ
jgi:hypothetical protein